MTETETTRPALKAKSGRRFRLPSSLPFFALFFLYFALEIDPRLIYQGGGIIDNFPTFYKGWDFFRSFLNHPGGPLEYVSAFAAQFLYYRWVGAAVVTVQAWALCLCIDLILARLELTRWRAIRFVPGLLLLAVYSQYAFHFHETMAFLAALAATGLYLRFRPEQPVGAIAFFLVISLALYATAGGAFLLFVLLCVITEILFRRALLIGAAQILIGAALPYVLGVILYKQWIHDAYFELLPLSWKITQYVAAQLMLPAVYALYAFLPAVLIVTGLGRLLPLRRDSGVTDNRSLSTRILDSFGDSHLGLNLQTLVVIAAATAVILLWRDTRLRMLYQVDYYVHQKMWSKVLDIGRRRPYHYLICHAVDRALYHTGKLGDELFAYPQDPSSLLLTGRDMRWWKAETCMDLGLINEAENAGMVFLEALGPRPQLLEHLAVVNMVKGNAAVARLFLNNLVDVPFWGPTARDYLARLEADPTLSGDEEIQRLRARQLQSDFIRPADSLPILLAENPKNRMAYEYYMARLLLGTRGGANPRNLTLFAQAFDELHAQNASRTPKHYEEALLLYRVLNKLPLDASGQPFAPETRERLAKVVGAVKKYGKDKDSLRHALEAEVGDSYFYYFFVGDSRVDPSKTH